MAQATMRKRIRQYEHFLHDLYFASSVTMDAKRVGELIDNASRWSYAHRQGNGELSEREQRQLVRSAFDRLLESPHELPRPND